MRFKLSHCLIAVLVLGLAMGLFTNHVRHQRQIRSLRDTINNSRETLHTIEYGAANLRLLELNPAIWEDRDCLPFLKHELAFAVLDHWQNQDAIDEAVGTSGYAMDFATRALSFFDCTSADDFITLTKSELSIYPDDGLRHSVWELSDTEIASFDAFIRCAATRNSQSGE